MSWAVVVVGAGSLAYKAISGAAQKRQGNKLINQQYPEYQIPTEISQGANVGLPSEQYAMAMKNIDRNQAFALSGARDRRSGLGMLARTQQATNDATLKLDVANAQARQQNQKILAGYKDKQWQYNTKGKYDRDYNYGMNLVGAGNQNISSGVDDLISSVGSVAYRGGFNGLFKKGTGNSMSRMAYNNNLSSSDL